MAHVDGTDQESGISPLISRIQEVSLGYPSGRHKLKKFDFTNFVEILIFFNFSGRLELHLVGGYGDPRGYSERIVINILRK